MTIFPDLETELLALAQRVAASDPDQPRPSGRSRVARGLKSMDRRRLGLLTGLCVFAFGGAATAAVIGVQALLATAPADQLFQADPQIWNQFNHDHPPSDGVLQRSVREVQTLRIPRAGVMQYWVARTRSGGSCEAFKLPDGTWAGTISGDVRYNFGGIVPGCHTPNRYGNVANGGGFDFNEDSFGPSPITDPHAASDFTFVVFGTVDVSGAVKVRDMQTGRVTRIVDHDFFAITRPAHDQISRPGHPPTGPQFQALSSSGKVLSTSWTNQRIIKSFEHHNDPR